MGYPGRVGVVCASCGAPLQEIAGRLRCPWAREGPDCQRPYGLIVGDQAGEYLRDKARKR